MVSINPDVALANNERAGDIPQTPSRAKGESGPDYVKPFGLQGTFVDRLRKVAADKSEVTNDVDPSATVTLDDKRIDPAAVKDSSATILLPSVDDRSSKIKIPGAMQTRSSNGISKKRVLEDAASISSDDELPKRISPPKKTKSSTTDTKNNAKSTPKPTSDDDAPSSEVEVVSVTRISADARYKKGIEAAICLDVDSKSLSGAEANAVAAVERTIIIKKEPGEKGKPSNDIDLSVSPLKLGSSVVPMDIDQDDGNPFLASPVELKNKSRMTQVPKCTDVSEAPQATDESEDMAKSDSPIDFIQKSKGKQKSKRILLSDGEFVEEEEAAMLLKALRESRRQAELDKKQLHTSGQLSTSSSAAPPALVNRDTPDALSTLEESSPVMGGDAVVPVNTGLPTPTTPARPARRTFMDVAPPLKTTKILSNSTTLLDDTMKFQVNRLPPRCEVTKAKELQDQLLADSYEHLPNLRYGILRAWNTGMMAAPMDCVVFSEWASQCPSLDYDNAERAVLFERHNNFINPSRVSPRDVNILYTSEDHKRAILQCNHVTAICLSPILSRESCILEPSFQGLRNKHLTGNFHHQEWERFASFACMVFDHKIMVAQIRDGCISFGTMGMKADRESISPTKPPRNPGILSIQRETKLKASNRNFRSNTRFRSVLDANDTIPVYDSRNYPFDFKGDLDRISETLPLYHGEIPPNSFVVVAYTMAQYEKDRAFYLSTNILYTILFGTETFDTAEGYDQEY